MASWFEGNITRLTKFGAFARLEDDLEGLIHISEISEKRIEHPKEVLQEGDAVTLRVIKIDPDNHRIGLSLRRVEFDGLCRHGLADPRARSQGTSNAER